MAFQIPTFHYIIDGFVQGVSFRYYTRSEANRLEIRGTVGNLDDGRVEVYAQGSESALQEFELFLYKGPSHSRVVEVSREEIQTDQKFLGFSIVF